MIESPEKLLEAERQVDAFIQLLFKRYGVKEDEIPVFLEVLRASVERERRLSQLSWHALLGLVSAIVLGALALLIEGFKHWVKH